MEQVRSVGEDAEWDRVRVEEDPVLWELAMTDKAHREELAKSPPYDVLERKVAAACEAQGVPMFPEYTAEELAENFQQAAKMMAGADASLPDEVEPCLLRRRCRPWYVSTTRSWKCDACQADLLLMRVVPADE